MHASHLKRTILWLGMGAGVVLWFSPAASGQGVPAWAPNVAESVARDGGKDAGSVLHIVPIYREPDAGPRRSFYKDTVEYCWGLTRLTHPRRSLPARPPKRPRWMQAQSQTPPCRQPQVWTPAQTAVDRTWVMLTVSGQPMVAISHHAPTIPYPLSWSVAGAPGIGPAREKALWLAGAWDRQKLPVLLEELGLRGERAGAVLDFTRHFDNALHDSDFERVFELLPTRERWRAIPLLLDGAAYVDIETDGSELITAVAVRTRAAAECWVLGLDLSLIHI